MEINIKWNICRVCLVEEQTKAQKTGAVDPMRNIFNDDEMLAKQIYECSGITMKPNDNLPEKICKSCLTMIRYAVNFRKTCRASDTYLQSILQRTKSASELFKPQQQLLEEPSQEIDNTSFYCETGESDDSNALKQYKTLKVKGTDYFDKTSKKFWKKSNSAEINVISDDLIEHEEEEIAENDLNNIVERVELFNYEGNEESQIDEKSMESSQIQDFQTNELVYDGDNYEGNEDVETDSNDMNEIDNDKKENDHHSELNKKKLLHDECMEIYQPEDENSEFIKLEKKCQKELLDPIETEIEENQAQVTSTVVTKEFEVVEAQEECNSLSPETNQQREYIVDEYIIEANSSDVPLQNSSTVLIKSKKAKKNTNGSPAQLAYNKAAASGKSSLKGSSEHQVWICDLCGNHFTNRQVLNIHMKIHRQEKRHECELCSKRFITACNLQAHMRIHTGEKPFECQYCPRRFSDRSSNLRHERIHTNAKPYQCNECGKAFSLTTTLKKHLTVHSGERSYRCDICAKSFKLPHQLKAHKKTSAHKAVELLL